MRKFAKIEDGVVVQTQPYVEPGFVEVPSDTICGMIQSGDEFVVPVETPTERTERLQRAVKESALKTLQETDWKVLRHIGEKALGLPTTFDEETYLAMEAVRQSAREKLSEDTTRVR